MHPRATATQYDKPQTGESYGYNPFTENALGLGFGIQKSLQDPIQSFIDYADILYPVMYHVHVKGANLDTVTEIPMRTCRFSQNDPRNGQICPDFAAIGNPAANAEVVEIVDTNVDVGLLKGSPGEANSSYLVFGVRLTQDDTLNQSDREVLSSLRLVAFARHGVVSEHEWESDSPISSMEKRIATLRISSSVELSYFATVSKNTVKLQNDDFFTADVE